MRGQRREAGKKTIAGATLALALTAPCGCSPTPPPSPPSASPANTPMTSAVAPPPSSPQPARDEQLSLHQRQAQTSQSGLRVTLLSFVIEDVAADPNSGRPGYGLLIAKLELLDGVKTAVVEVVSPVGPNAAKPAVFGVHRVSFVSSASEYSKDPVIVVRVEKTMAP